MAAPIFGDWTFRFSGFAVAQDKASQQFNGLYNIVGIGRFNLSEDNRITGFHDSTIIRLSGPHNVVPQHSHYVWNGTYRLRDAGCGTFSVSFHPDHGDKPANLVDEFDFVLAEPNRLWFISNGPRILPEDIAVPEVVSAEAIRIS